MLTVSSCENYIISIITYYIINDLTWEKKTKEQPFNLTWVELSYPIDILMLEFILLDNSNYSIFYH